MSEYDNSNRVSLWPNKKRTEQKHPHLTGQGETDYPVWASAWFSKDLDPEDAKTLMGIIKRHAANSSKPLLTVSFKAQEERKPEPKRTSGGSVDPDDDIPF